MTKYYLGIDPGKSGGVTVIDASGNILGIYGFDHKDDLQEFLQWIDNAPSDYSFTACLEKVGAFPKQGVRSVWTFAENYGFWKGWLQGKKIPSELVAPKVWQKVFGQFSTDKPTRKGQLVEAARSLFPGEKILKPMGDSVLLAEYARRNAKG